MPLGMHKDSLLNLVELAAKAEQDKHSISASKQLIQQSAGISSTEAGGLPRCLSFGNEKQRDDLREENVEGNTSFFWPSSGNTGIVRVNTATSHVENKSTGIGDNGFGPKYTSVEDAGATYSDPTNRARPAVWREASQASNIASRGSTLWQSNMSYGTDLDSYFDPYASTDQAPPTRRGGGNSSCLCLFAPWGAAARADYADESDIEEDNGSGIASSGEKAQTKRREQNEGIVDSGDARPKPSSSASEPMAIPGSSVANDDDHEQVEEKENFHNKAGGTDTKKTDTTDVASTPAGLEILKFGSTPKQNVAGVMVKRSGSAPREKLLRKTLEQVQQLHATQQVDSSSPPGSPKQAHPGGMFRVLPSSASCSPPEKSLLKKHIVKLRESHLKDNAANDGQKDYNSGRRSIFAATDAATSTTDLSSTRTLSESIQRYHSGVRKTCRFSPTARVATIPSRDSLSLFDRSLIWWTRSDYDSFKKTGRTIVRAMVEGGSHIWLQSQFTREEKKKFETDETEDESTSEKMGEKWWCKFGHSRRGLEHIANMEEGRLRQQSVQNAMDAVMKEQRKQKIGSGSVNDSGKISRICQQYTRWAKELAILAGLGDAEAVRTEFQTHNAPVTSRAKMTRSSMYTSYVTRNFNFTSEAAEKDASRSCWNPGVLDEHTSGSLLVKLNDEYDMHAMAEEGVKAAREKKIADDSKAATIAVILKGGNISVSEYVDSEEPIRDARKSVGSLSKKAAGLGHGENELDRFLEKRFEKAPLHQAA